MDRHLTVSPTHNEGVQKLTLLWFKGMSDYLFHTYFQLGVRDSSVEYPNTMLVI
jgi:hypothetical protein